MPRAVGVFSNLIEWGHSLQPRKQVFVSALCSEQTTRTTFNKTSIGAVCVPKFGRVVFAGVWERANSRT